MATWSSASSIAVLRELVDAQRAVELAVRARNLRRIWRTDSAEATANAAEAAMVAEDPQLVWNLTRPAPDGEATEAEATDPRVIPLAAMGAALTGRIGQAHELVPIEDGYVRLRIEAEIASVSGEEARIDAWRAALDAATTDEEKLHALRGLAMEGAIDRRVLDELRKRHSETVAEIQLTAEIQAISGPDTDERLRALESRSPLASVRRADLLRHEEPARAAEILLDATERWQYPRLLLLAMDSYEDAGLLPQAEQIARQALIQFGSSWPSRATVLLRLFNIQCTRRDWAGATTTGRALLGADPNDQGLRWGLAWAQYRSGDHEQAWRTLKRPAFPLTPAVPSQALLLLDLTRKFAPADDVAQTALAMLQTFPEDREVHAAVMRAVMLRTDRTEVSEDANVAITHAREAFLERYADSQQLRTHTINVDSDNPLAEFEPALRQQAGTYQEALRLVRDMGYPMGLLQGAVNKPYSSIFLYRPLGYHRMVYPGLQGQATERDMALASLTNSCLLDASALYTLALLPDVAPTLLALIARPMITDDGLYDLVDADDMFSVPSAGTLTYDPVAGRAVAYADDPDISERQRTQIRNMLTTARGLRRITHPELMVLQSLEGEREPVWSLILDAAKHHNIPLWADDTGLRTAAHSLGIKTFSTHALLVIARERRRIDLTIAHEIVRELVRERTVDLPYDHEALMEVAAEENWEPRSVATVLSRSATWSHGRQPLDLFITAFRNATDSYAQAWAHAAIDGLRDTQNPDHIDTRLKAITTIALWSEIARPERSAIFVTALEAAVPERAGAVVRAALKNLWTVIKNAALIEEAVTIFLQIFSGLNDEYRQYGTHLILEP